MRLFFKKEVLPSFLVLLFLGIYDAAYIAHWAASHPVPPFADFFGFWSFGKFAAQAGAAIYTPAALGAFQHSLDPSVPGSYPYPYPPTFLLALVPLGRLALPSAYLCWVVSTFLLYLVATLGRGWRSLAGFALLVAPTTLLTIISGQNGLLTAALLVGGLRALARRPALAGVLFGLLTYKPHFVLLLPFVLLAARQFRTIAAAILTGVATIAITSVMFGAAIWPDWLAGFPAYQTLLQANQGHLDHLMPTILAGMHAVGAPMIAGYAVQGAESAVVIVLVWRAFAKGVSDRAISMAIVGALIVAPYAMIYDTPMLASAVALSWRARRRAGRAIHIREITLVIVTFACLLTMVTAALPFVAPALIGAVFLTFANVPGAGQVQYR